MGWGRDGGEGDAADAKAGLPRTTVVFGPRGAYLQSATSDSCMNTVQSLSTMTWPSMAIDNVSNVVKRKGEGTLVTVVSIRLSNLLFSPTCPHRLCIHFAGQRSSGARADETIQNSPNKPPFPPLPIQPQPQPKTEGHTIPTTTPSYLLIPTPTRPTSFTHFPARVERIMRQGKKGRNIPSTLGWE